MARRKEAHGGGHGWFVTFADLMGLLVSFFVMLVAFSNQDSQKVQAVTGSMRQAFGVQKIARYSGVEESDGLPTRLKIKHMAHIEPMDSSITPTPEGRHSASKQDPGLALAAASLRQEMQGMPELTEISRHVIIEDGKQGLNIEIVDQAGSSMFPEGSSEPYPQTRRLLQKIAGPLKAVPYRIAIAGHTSGSEGGSQIKYEPWQLSVDRANAVRRILEEQGYPSANIYDVVGNAYADPLFPEDPSMAPNRRVTITLIYEPPPAPPDLRP
jgi:chemotaxis protein MotB